MKLDLSFEQNQQNINVPFSESGGRFSANFGETSVIHDGQSGAGQSGATFYPDVSADGTISWTNDRGLPNPNPVNIKGEKGAKGDKGDKGERGEQGIQGLKGETGEQGEKGTDGTSATHRWSGTTLYITSASGTSSANLKGEKGDPGANGKDGTNGTNGKDGVDGYTPVKGKDYFTETDKAEIVSSVIAELPIYDGSVTSV